MLTEIPLDINIYTLNLYINIILRTINLVFLDLAILSMK